jgi:hypothetical protein
VTGQTKTRSMIESWVNVVVGLAINIMIQRIVFPMYGWDVSYSENIQLSLIFTVVSVVRSYGLRRLFNWWDAL